MDQSLVYLWIFFDFCRDFSHEMALAVKTEHGLAIFSSCHGAVNIINSCVRFVGVSKVSHFIGGLHFVDCNRTADEVVAFCECVRVRLEYSNTSFITGHCTSDKAKTCFKEVGFNIRFFRTGEVIYV